MPSSSFSINAEVAARRFTLDAWLVGERWRHHRVRDHSGAESDLSVVLSERVGKYEAYTPVHHVIEDLLARLIFLEDYDRTRGSFTLDAYLSGNAIQISAALKKAMSASFAIDAYLNRGGAFGIDAILVGRFTVDAFLV